MSDFAKYTPIRLIPFPEPVALANGWFRRSWSVQVALFDPTEFLPPPVGGLDIAQLIVSVVPGSGGWLIRIDSKRRDDPHDLAYASLVLQRVVGAERETATIDGHRRHPMLNIAREA